MRKHFEMPVIGINKFHAENIVTTSGTGTETTNVTNMQKAMENAGYTVKAVDIAAFTF